MLMNGHTAQSTMTSSSASRKLDDPRPTSSTLLSKEKDIKEESNGIRFSNMINNNMEMRWGKYTKGMTGKGRKRKVLYLLWGVRM